MFICNCLMAIVPVLSIHFPHSDKVLTIEDKQQTVLVQSWLDELTSKQGS
ncbi:hypothetical protein RS130_16585 [Paraglaciecola aquimarina]|uniref:Uncharacterized protein n=1 Tax=Paraglaciecola aquimarina TaxID=1235557 RepID=A0ABU3SZ80_9ALTE|nr:hypothetical protein [Paraglaciecola aquimarina]MDU0355308.1 hypothetical protein [Paraglaciecola aquimarina]